MSARSLPDELRGVLASGSEVSLAEGRVVCDEAAGLIEALEAENAALRGFVQELIDLSFDGDLIDLDYLLDRAAALLREEKSMTSRAVASPWT